MFVVNISDHFWSVEVKNISSLKDHLSSNGSLVIAPLFIFDVSLLIICMQKLEILNVFSVRADHPNTLNIR